MQETPTKIFSPRVDVVFKMLFGDQRSKDILTDFLRAVLQLPESEFAELTIIDPHLKRETPDDKLGILDVKLKTAGGDIINIEIQCRSMADMRSRITYYSSNMITEQIGDAQPYSNLKRAICIVIVDFDLIHESNSHHTVFQMREREEGFLFNDLLEINVLNLTKIPKDRSDALINWMKFLKADREEEFEMAASTSPAINNAYLRLQNLSASEANRMIYEARLKAQRDEWSRLAGARQEGRVEERAGIILTMSRQGLNAKAIAGFTGLSETQVEEMLRSKPAG